MRGWTATGGWAGRRVRSERGAPGPTDWTKHGELPATGACRLPKADGGVYNDVDLDTSSTQESQRNHRSSRAIADASTPRGQRLDKHCNHEYRSQVSEGVSETQNLLPWRAQTEGVNGDGKLIGAGMETRIRKRRSGSK